jgi:hypothetical protein
LPPATSSPPARAPARRRFPGPGAYRADFGQLGSAEFVFVA